MMIATGVEEEGCATVLVISIAAGGERRSKEVRQGVRLGECVQCFGYFFFDYLILLGLRCRAVETFLLLAASALFLLDVVAPYRDVV